MTAWARKAAACQWEAWPPSKRCVRGATAVDTPVSRADALHSLVKISSLTLPAQSHAHHPRDVRGGDWEGRESFWY